MDQNVILVETVPLEFDLESLGCRLRIRPGQTKFMDRLSRLAEEAARVARPKAVARLCGLTILDEEKVQVGEVTFSSPLLRQKMDGLGRAFPYWASEGTELADWSLSLSSSLEQVFASALREVAVQQAENLLERTLLERYGIAQVSAMNPGSLKVWSLEEQVPLFELLAPLPEKLGVTLLPSLMSTVFRVCSSRLTASFTTVSSAPKKSAPTAGLPLWSPESGTDDAVEKNRWAVP